MENKKKCELKNACYLFRENAKFRKNFVYFTNFAKFSFCRNDNFRENLPKSHDVFGFSSRYL
jgi:hypothetical protein